MHFDSELDGCLVTGSKAELAFLASQCYVITVLLIPLHFYGKNDGYQDCTPVLQVERQQY